MVQFNLPSNSKIKKGQYYKDKTGSKNIRKVKLKLALQKTWFDLDKFQ